MRKILFRAFVALVTVAALGGVGYILSPPSLSKEVCETGGGLYVEGGRFEGRCAHDQAELDRWYEVVN